MLTMKNIDMNTEDMHGPFNNVFCISRDGRYQIIAYEQDDDEARLFQSELIKYYGDMRTEICDGDIKSGLKIQKYPIYVYVNPDPDDNDGTRVEIDFS